MAYICSKALEAFTVRLLLGHAQTKESNVSCHKHAKIMEHTTLSRLSSQCFPQQHKQPEETSLVLCAIQIGNFRDNFITRQVVHPNMSDVA